MDRYFDLQAGWNLLYKGNIEVDNQKNSRLTLIHIQKLTQAAEVFTAP